MLRESHALPLSHHATQLTSAGSTDALHSTVVDRLVLVDYVDNEDDADVEYGELFADCSCRQLTESVHMRRCYDDRSRPLHNHSPSTGKTNLDCRGRTARRSALRPTCCYNKGWHLV